MCTEYCWQDNSEEKKFTLHFFYVNMITCPKVLFLILKSRPFSVFYFFYADEFPFIQFFIQASYSYTGQLSYKNYFSSLTII